MAEPPVPVPEGAVQATVAWEAPAVAVTAVGTAGRVRGATAAEAARAVLRHLATPAAKAAFTAGGVE